MKSRTKIALDPHRDRTRLAKALHAASWCGAISWNDIAPRDRRNYRDQARRLMIALEQQEILIRKST